MTGNSGLELNGMPAAGDVSGAATSNDDKHSKRMKHPHLPTEMALSNYTLANDMCQHNVDALNDANETHKLLASDSRDDNNQTTSNDSNRKRQKMICYDFQKGGCRRRVCRYPHVTNPEQVVFCHDYQNSGCFRPTCKFIHRPIEDEEYYREFGYFPATDRPLQAPPPPINPISNHYHQPIDNGLPSPLQAQFPSQPLHHASHPPPLQLPQHTQNSPLPPHSSHPSHPPHSNFSPHTTNTAHPPPSHPQQLQNPLPPTHQHLQQQPVHRHPFCDNGNEPLPPKRLHLDDRYANQMIGPPPVQQPPTQVITSNQVTSLVIGEDIVNIVRLIEDQNILRRRIEANEERIQELRASNQYLLQQNEKIVNQLKCGCTKTIVPVTLTTASQSATTTQVLSAVSIAPVQVQATPIVSIASIGQSASQILASSAPIAITATTQGQPLTIASTQQGGQIIATPQITLATGTSMGITMDTSQPLAISANSTQPIISIPVMTHSILPH